MSGSIVVGKSAEEYFRELVGDALASRRLKVQEETEFYLVNLLARFLEREQLFVEAPGGGAEAEPLALILMRALAADRARRYQGLKRLGDTSLFVSGFFGDSLARAAVDVSYYIAMGGRAYGALGDAAIAPAGMTALYAELSARFEQFVDLYAEIAELSDLSSNRGLVRLYERFLVTGSRRVARRLEERGVALFAGPPRPRRGDVH
ncbi:hypothetical protein [Anaeromyxobacter paludicola]|uniref:Uncharacterized protein n=1 Tax=Anaeromyxobacter paludicola TaxID=2918171 RepID=A0ABN6N6V9_9BACT|nr:hypothetical protein [Anaeromyxobacter paludicola]BDG08906.1 hypothetical protein AMPC_20190 [Anaeromyxobacter paludicola]